MRERWMVLCARIGRGDADTLFALLESQYTHPPRAYHSLQHVSACLSMLDGCRGLALHADELEFALWLHDCVYIPQRKDNEERSAAVAIRTEYSFASGPEYQRGRTAFLEGLLKRAAIYYTPWFADCFEQRARSNVSREIAALN